MEIRSEIKTYKTNKVCEACGEGNMICQDHSGSDWERENPHTCNYCSTTQMLSKKYPIIETTETVINP